MHAGQLLCWVDLPHPIYAAQYVRALGLSKLKLDQQLAEEQHESKKSEIQCPVSEVRIKLSSSQEVAMSRVDEAAARVAGNGKAEEEEECRYKGVRRRRWGKWVSEIRVPGSRERLWLGSYATPQAAAVAHDAAVFFLRGADTDAALNFPERAAAAYGMGTGAAAARLSPRSVQRVASDAGMFADAQLVEAREQQRLASGEISVDDMEILM